MPVTLKSGSAFPTMSFDKVGGGTIKVGGDIEKWTLFIVYRGKHCGRCKKYLNQLEAMQSEWHDANFEIAVVSADTEEKAKADIAEFGWTFDIGFGLSQVQMKQLGLFVSTPLSETETDRAFAEPGIFCITPSGDVQIISVSNGPAVRPDLVELLDGMIFTIKNDRPARGDLEL